MADPDWRNLVGYRSAAEILAECQSTLQAWGARLNNWNVGSRTRTRYELVSVVTERLYALAATIAQQAFWTTATGEWLRQHARDEGLTPREARKAQGTLTVVCSAPTTVRPGHTFATPPNSQRVVTRFNVRAETSLVVGSNAVPVEAVVAGVAGNVAVGTITVPENVPAGITSVTNGTGWLTLEGLDTETNEALKVRISAERAAGGGETLEQYEAWALAADAGVGSVRALEVRGPGSVDVLVMGVDGVPSSGLLTTITTHINAQRQMCRDVLVRGATPTATTVTATIWLRPDAPDLLSDVQARAVDRVQALFNPDATTGVTPLGIGAPLRRTGRLLDVLRGSASSADLVDRVDLASPGADVVVAPDGIVTLSTAPTITVRRYLVAADGSWVE